MIRIHVLVLPFLFAVTAYATSAAQQATPGGELFRDGDRVVFIGNTFAERMSLFPHFEVELTLRFPDRGLTFRNLGWSGDEITLMPRPLNFGELDTHLSEQRADVIFAFFGMNESFAGVDGLPKFRSDLEAFLSGLLSQRFNGHSPPRIVLVSPIAHERVTRVPLDPGDRNRVLALYSDAMRDIAARQGIRFLDLFTPTLALYGRPGLGEITINGIHPDDRGYWLMSRLMLAGLGLLEPREVDSASERLAGGAGPARSSGVHALERLVREKNDLFFYRWRPVNGEYVYGRRKEPFGVVNFPEEMRQLESMIAEQEARIREAAKAAGRSG